MNKVKVAIEQTGAQPDNSNPQPAPIPRMAFSVNECAEALGVAPISVRRLLARGLLQSAPGLRHRVIPKTSIENYLTGGVQ